MKAVYPFLVLGIGIFSVSLFHFDVFLPVWTSAAILMTGVSLFLWSGYQHKRVGVLMLLLWLVYALPFIHIVPYLWFDFGNDDPFVLWGLAVNSYMLEEGIVQLTAMIGAVGGLGFALGIFLSNQAIVRDAGLSTNANQRRVKTFSNPIWVVWVIGGVSLFWLTAPHVAMTFPHWLWYGEKNGFNSLVICFFVSVAAFPAAYIWICFKKFIAAKFAGQQR